MRHIIFILIIIIMFGCTTTNDVIKIPRIQWDVQASGTIASLRGLSAVNPRVAWASGSQGTVVRTTDGGETWKSLTVTGGSSLDFRDIHAFDRNRAVIISAGQPAKVFKTVGYHSITFARGSNKGWAAGSEGRIARCTVNYRELRK